MSSESTKPTTQSTAEDNAESDVEILSSQSNKANVTDAAFSPSTSEASTSGATAEPPPSKKIRHAEISLDKTIVDLTEEILTET